MEFLNLKQNRKGDTCMGVIKILGAFGNRGVDSQTTCIQISKHAVIDAGNIIDALGESAKYIDKIFLTHSHLDHILDSAFLCDIFFSTRREPLKIYGLKETLETLKKHIFNWKIWPDFSSLNLINSKYKSLEFIEIKTGDKIEVESVFLTPVISNHTVECCGYLIEDDSGALLFTSDTYKNDKTWELLNSNHKIKSIIIDVSFPADMEDVAKASLHLTPKLLSDELSKLKRDDVKVFVNHLKPNYKEQILRDLEKIGIDRKSILYGGEVIDYGVPKIIQTDMSSHTKRVQKLNKIGIALSSNGDIEFILELIVREAKNLTGADGGTLYLLDKGKKELDFKVVQTKSLGINLGGVKKKIDWPSIPLYLKDGSENKKMVAAVCALEERIINIKDVYNVQKYDFSGTKKFDKNNSYHSISMLVVPLKDHEKNVIGVLQLINKEDGFDVIPFSHDDEDIILSLASQAAIAITNTKLIEDLERLLESFLKSITFALGKKSSFTANHIHKMVALSKMIAKAVNRDQEFFKDKNFSENDIKQINFAALMHDVGKLATPDYILEKATKLDGLFDRIELIKSRKWAISKELEVEFLKGHIKKSEYDRWIKYLDESMLLIEESNAGSEFLSDVYIEKIEKLEETPIECGEKKFFLLTTDEAQLLKIQRGTLSKKEREIINRHALDSLEILNRLPFPDKYKDIPSIAGAHHEKINGKGYPLGLKDDEISFEARILAIADIFEALTADDRPYKKPNKLSKAMKILYFMAQDGELDKELVRFFYETKLYLQFAQKSLKKENIDDVILDFNSS